MLSVKNVTAEQASSYYEKDDYYVRKDETSLWQGKLKDVFGLGDEITKEDFDNLIMLNEKDKLTQIRKNRACFDLCFSAPKSVSIAFCIDEYKEEILAAHNKAVEDTLKLIEENEIYTRITQDKVTKRVLTGNMLCGKFNHYVSRNQDPQIHTHCVILNYTVYNGQKYAISNEGFYENKLLYGQIYRNYLAYNLREQGFEIAITDKKHGFFELAGVDKDIIE